jgi:hypothetical protein
MLPKINASLYSPQPDFNQPEIKASLISPCPPTLSVCKIKFRGTRFI